MLFMSVLTWEPEQRNEIVKRRLGKGTMVPDGIKMHGEWTEVSGGRDFILFETEDYGLAMTWNLTWSDLIKTESVMIQETSNHLSPEGGRF